MSVSPLLQCQQPGTRSRNRKGCWLLLYQTLELLARAQYPCHAEGHREECLKLDSMILDFCTLHQEGGLDLLWNDCSPMKWLSDSSVCFPSVRILLENLPCSPEYEMLQPSQLVNLTSLTLMFAPP